MNKKIIILFIIVTSLICHSLDFGTEVNVIVYNIYGQEEFSGSFKVNQFNKLILPLIGEIDVKGLDEKMLKSVIYDRLHPNIFLKPTVSVFTDEVFFSISGYIKKEGKFRFDKKILLSDAINIAGGLADGADTYNIAIKRNTGQIMVDYDLFKQGKKGGQNPEILHQDEIIIKELDYLYVLGEVNEAFKTYYDKRATVVDLILKAKATRRSALKYAKVFRKDGEDNFTQINVNLENVFRHGKINDMPELKPGDVLFIPKNRGSGLDLFNFTTDSISGIFSSVLNIKTVKKDLF